MVHSGGFYTVEKQKSLGVAAEQVQWFRWEALMTWVAGVILLVLVYYLGDGLIDPDVADISSGSDLWHHHDPQRVDAYSSRTAQNDRRRGGGREVRFVGWRASEVAFETQYVPGNTRCLLDVEQSLSGGDLWKPLCVGDYVGADCSRMGCCKVNP